MSALWSRFWDWVWSRLTRAHRQRAVEFARLALAIHERHVHSLPPLPDEDLLEAAECVLAWQAEEHVVGLDRAAATAQAIVDRCDNHEEGE